MNQKRTGIVMSLMLPVLLILLATEASPQSWKTEWEKTVALANGEGKVVVAGGAGESFRNALTAFRKSYPDIQLDYVGVIGRDFAPRIVQERRADQFLWDVHFGGASSIMGPMVAQGAVDPLQPALILPEVLNDGKWRNGFKEGWMDREGKHVYGFVESLLYAVYVNRDFVSEGEFNKGEDLWNPKWKGKIVWYDPRSGGSGGHQGLMILLNYGEESLRRLLREQEPVLTTDYRQQVQWLAQGRYPIAIGLLESSLRPFQKEGVGKNIKPLKEPKLTSTAGSFGHLALINKPPHPNAAKVLINWLLSKEGQEAWVKATGDNSRRLDAPVGNPEMMPQPGVKYINTQKQEHAEMVSKRVNPIAKEILQ